MLESIIRRNEHIAVKKTKVHVLDDESRRMFVPLTPCMRCAVVLPMLSLHDGDVNHSLPSTIMCE